MKYLKKGLKIILYTIIAIIGGWYVWTQVLTTTDTSTSKLPPTAICRDGSYSYSQHRQGTCSRHGGVSEWK